MRKLTLTLMLFGVLLALAAVANAQKDRLVGTFVTTDANERSITQVTLSADNQIHVWGKCHPTDCDWGVVSTNVYGPGVEANLDTSAKALSAFYNPGFANVIVIVTPLPEDRVRVETFTKFIDRSRRTDYFNKQTLVREDTAMALKP